MVGTNGKRWSIPAVWTVEKEGWSGKGGQNIDDMLRERGSRLRFLLVTVHSEAVLITSLGGLGLDQETSSCTKTSEQ
ncbi:hypothetical protein PoB_003038500 [Plakobranchus ocellatus]|uniref:Uncharacterized protein n=1 Tax=Plakobranchus ocellatus TaxID=259542 RepID=A0AAV4A6S3_9GAST|nr:hypothetical protein PoB_003038500 [Plakobranchus ocellatus]